MTSLGLKPAARTFDTGAMATALRSDAPRPLLPLSLDDYAPAPINAPDVIDGNPVARGHHVVEGPGAWDAGFWDCTAGRFRWYYGDPELVHILEGEVLVTDGAGVRHHLRPGDIFLFPRRTTWEWEVPDYVRKAFVMHPSPTDRARRRVRGLRRRVARLRDAASAHRAPPTAP